MLIKPYFFTCGYHSRYKSAESVKIIDNLIKKALDTSSQVHVHLRIYVVT